MSRDSLEATEQWPASELVTQLPHTGASMCVSLLGEQLLRSSSTHEPFSTREGLARQTPASNPRPGKTDRETDGILRAVTEQRSVLVLAAAELLKHLEIKRGMQ